MDNSIGQARRESVFATVSKAYHSVPTLCKTALKQGAFILAMHCVATGISEYRSDGKDGEKVEELTMEQKIMAGFFASMFSGTFRAICSQLTQSEIPRRPETSPYSAQSQLVVARESSEARQQAV